MNDIINVYVKSHIHEYRQEISALPIYKAVCVSCGFMTFIKKDVMLAIERDKKNDRKKK